MADHTLFVTNVKNLTESKREEEGGWVWGHDLATWNAAYLLRNDIANFGGPEKWRQASIRRPPN